MTGHELFLVLLPLLSLAINAGCQVATFRFLIRSLLRSVFWGFGCGLVSLAGLTLATTDKPAGNPAVPIFIGITNVTIYIIMSYGYFHFINLGETARRIRIMWELYDAPQGLSATEILDRYNAQEIVKTRIERLLSNGQLRHRDGRFVVGRPSVLFMAKLIITLKLLVLGKRSEFA